MAAREIDPGAQMMLDRTVRAKVLHRNARGPDPESVPESAIVVKLTIPPAELVRSNAISVAPDTRRFEMSTWAPETDVETPILGFMMTPRSRVSRATALRSSAIPPP